LSEVVYLTLFRKRRTRKKALELRYTFLEGARKGEGGFHAVFGATMSSSLIRRRGSPRVTCSLGKRFETWRNGELREGKNDMKLKLTPFDIQSSYEGGVKRSAEGETLQGMGGN